jgi:hypothetical protein
VHTNNRLLLFSELHSSLASLVRSKRQHRVFVTLNDVPDQHASEGVQMVKPAWLLECEREQKQVNFENYENEQTRK